MESSVDLLARNAIWWGSRLAGMWSLMCWMTSFSKRFITTGECRRVVYDVVERENIAEKSCMVKLLLQGELLIPSPSPLY